MTQTELSFPERIKIAKRTQISDIFDWFNDHDSLTAIEAAVELGILQLSARINEIEKQGYEVPREDYTGKSRRGQTYSAKRYFRPVKRLGVV